MNVSKRVTGWSKDAKGDTIVEILMAICILAVGILAVVAMQTSSAKGNSTSSQSTDGLIFAVDKIEKLMELSWTHADLDSAGNTHTVTEGRYTIEWDITDDGVISDTKTINMRVTWSNWGTQKQISVQHLIPRII